MPMVKGPALSVASPLSVLSGESVPAGVGDEHAARQGESGYGSDGYECLP